MIKLIIMDLDGVLIDAKEIHYETFNNAIRKYTNNSNYLISREEHLSRYDGLNTKAKLNMLTAEKQMPVSYHEPIFTLKQLFTQEALRDLVPNHSLIDCLKRLKEKYTLCVASNSVRSTIHSSLYYSGLSPYFDFTISNEDVKNPKPNAEMYLQCMIKAGVSPKETLIIEDSLNGRKGAESTGALVMGVNSPKDVTCQNISEFLQIKQNIKMKWKDNKLNILIPMAGRGSRFEETGKYSFPKPLIEVKDKPMIQLVVENLNIEAHYIFLVQKEHYIKYNLKTLLNLIAPNCDIVVVDGVTEGAACTSLLAKEYINNDRPLLIANSDQFLEWNSGEFMYSMMGDQIDGGIVTFKATHPKWSFVRTNDLGLVTEVAEKNPISDTATVGVYFWKKGSEYVRSAEQMISKNIRVNNEFYVAPTYNELVGEGKLVKIHNISKMWGIGDPSSLDTFLNDYKGEI